MTPSKPSRPPVQPGDLVVVLHWERSWADLPTPLTVVVPSYMPFLSSGAMWVEYGEATSVAYAWRLPSPEERAAYQLGQLAGGGL